MGIDLGSTTAKVVALDPEDRVLAQASAPTGFVYPQPEWVEMDLETAWQAVVAAVRAVAAALRADGWTPGSIGLSALGPALAVFDPDGRPLRRAIVYADRRAAPDALAVTRTTPVDRLVRLTGVRWVPGMASGVMLRWLLREEPATYARGAWIGHPSTMLLHRLAGRVAIDYAAAQVTGLFAYDGPPRWSAEAATGLGVPVDKLPPPVDPAVPAGTLTPTAAATLGLPEGIPISAGANDSTCAGIALGVFGRDAEAILLGTTNAVVASVVGPQFGPEFVMRRSLRPGEYLAVGATATGGASLQWLAALMGRADDVPARLDRLIGDATLALDAPLFLPHLAGERSPLWDPDAPGVLYGLALETSPAAVALAGAEGNAYAGREVLDAMRGRFGSTPAQINVTGSQAHSARFLQTLADAIGLPLHAAPSADAAPVGAALLGRLAAGSSTLDALVARAVPWTHTVRPDPSARRLMNARYARYRTLYHALQAVRHVWDGP
ncbi:MAG: hypothetical protein FJ029_09020 [Actinobacteria bacterium]|nr:hypothetical protein [Actinomycetota bacterium]